MLVAGAAVCLERAPVPREGFVQLTLDVREDPQVLFHARPQLAALPPELQRSEEVHPRTLQRAGLEIQHAEGVQRFRGEQIVVDLARHVVAPLAQLAGPRRVVPLVPHDREAPQRLGQHRVLPGLLRRRDRGLVARHRFRDATGPLPTPRFMEQVGSPAARPQGASRS